MLNQFRRSSVLSYAASRAYWQKLDGLRGLRQYGCDEQLISLKAWLDGGSCVLLKHVVLGHIYRKRMPYDVAWSVPVFNNLLVTETLFPLRERVMARAAAYTADRQEIPYVVQSDPRLSHGKSGYALLRIGSP